MQGRVGEVVFHRGVLVLTAVAMIALGIPLMVMAVILDVALAAVMGFWKSVVELSKAVRIWAMVFREDWDSA